jgi:hypothetical protein
VAGVGGVSYMVLKAVGTKTAARAVELEEEAPEDASTVVPPTL